jgi:hypothetical protein
MRLDPLVVQQQIANIRLQYPELANDEEAWALTIESETDAHELLQKLEDKRRLALIAAAQIKGSIEGLKINIINDLEARLARMDRCDEGMRKLLFKVMEMAGIRSKVFPYSTLSIANGQQHVIITDEAIIPDVLFRIKREPDKARIKEMLKAGQTVRGAELSNAEPHLTIRTK